MSAITPTATVGSSKSSKLCKLTLGSLRTINNAKATDSTYIVNLADSNVSTKDDEQRSAGRSDNAMDRMRNALK